MDQRLRQLLFSGGPENAEISFLGPFDPIWRGCHDFSKVNRNAINNTQHVVLQLCPDTVDTGYSDILRRLKYPRQFPVTSLVQPLSCGF